MRNAVRGRLRGGAAALAVALWGWAPTAGAEVALRVEVSSPSVAVGALFEVAILADFDAPILGWGLDLAFDDTLIGLTGEPQIGGLWNVPVSSADGDGLAGAYFPPLGGVGLSGADVLLATLEFEALAEGFSALALAFSAADLSEGFALDPFGFEAEVSYANGGVSVVPEPGSGLLAGLALATWAVARRMTRVGRPRRVSRRR